MTSVLRFLQNAYGKLLISRVKQLKRWVQIVEVRTTVTEIQ